MLKKVHEKLEKKMFGIFNKMQHRKNLTVNNKNKESLQKNYRRYNTIEIKLL